MAAPDSTTHLLRAIGEGNLSAQKRLWELVYQELHHLAQQQLVNDPIGRTRQPTSLVHEAFLRLAANEEVRWADRTHFFRTAAQAMRRIRVDDARKRDRLKRGAGRKPVVLDQDPAGCAQDPAELLAVNEALDRLAAEYPEKAEVVALRYFAGLTIDEAAAATGVSPRKIDKDWSFARAWLYRELTKDSATRTVAGCDGH
jgi:RNA polymerase sigma factor (TIGR02999 family)